MSAVLVVRPTLQKSTIHETTRTIVNSLVPFRVISWIVCAQPRYEPR